VTVTTEAEAANLSARRAACGDQRASSAPPHSRRGAARPATGAGLDGPGTAWRGSARGEMADVRQACCKRSLAAEGAGHGPTASCRRRTLRS
jgi:hypothetical protein